MIDRLYRYHSGLCRQSVDEDRVECHEAGGKDKNGRCYDHKQLPPFCKYSNGSFDIPEKSSTLTWPEFIRTLCCCNIGDYFEGFGVIRTTHQYDAMRRFAQLIKERGGIE